MRTDNDSSDPATLWHRVANQRTRHLDDRFAHPHPLGPQIDVADSQPGDLRAAASGTEQQLEDQSVLTTAQSIGEQIEEYKVRDDNLPGSIGCGIDGQAHTVIGLASRTPSVTSQLKNALTMMK